MCLFVVLLKFQAVLKFRESNYKPYNKKGFKSNKRNTNATNIIKHEGET